MSDHLLRCHRPVTLGHITRCQLLSAPAANGFSWRRLWRGMQRSFRLMVGVQDYENYRQHMLQHHPEKPVMTEREFHRYCLDARFPSQAGKLGKCPC